MMHIELKDLIPWAIGAIGVIAGWWAKSAGFLIKAGEKKREYEDLLKEVESMKSFKIDLENHTNRRISEFIDQSKQEHQKLKVEIADRINDLKEDIGKISEAQTQRMLSTSQAEKDIAILQTNLDGLRREIASHHETNSSILEAILSSISNK